MQRRIRILGGGESGIGAALLAKKMKYDVFLSDFGKIEESKKEELEKYKIPFEEGGHTFEILVQADLVIKSPGIKDDVKIILDLKNRGIEVVSEIEFAFQHNKGKVIAITGSNGKTTTTHLIYHLLSASGRNVAEVGNVGKSFARQIFEEETDIYVVEVSSFQLDGIKTFKPDVAILLNITADHLDRYGYDVEKYAMSKFRIVENMGPADTFIYAAFDHGIMSRFHHMKCNAKLMPIDISSIKDDGLISIDEGWDFNVAEANLLGRHNQMNLLAAFKSVQVVGMKRKEIENAISSFKNEEHRLEAVRELDGVLYINDSKATNVDAVYYALEAMKQPIIWIAGGTDKGNEYDALFELVKEKVNALICLGMDNQKLKEAFTDKVKILKETQQMEEAVNWAKDLAKEGDVVLLSPACASFDLFKNYKDRGDQFKRKVKELIPKNIQSI